MQDGAISGVKKYLLPAASWRIKTNIKDDHYVQHRLSLILSNYE
jgi:hypothetical protein